jgi:hypothetical protein
MVRVRFTSAGLLRQAMTSARSQSEHRALAIRQTTTADYGRAMTSEVVGFRTRIDMGRRGLVEGRVEFDPKSITIDLFRADGRIVFSRKPVVESVTIEGGVFHWQDFDLHPLDDDYGLAVAMAHIINERLRTRGARDDPMAVLMEPLGSVQRYQYAVVSIGMYRSPERMGDFLSLGGMHGWRLLAVYDKSSNWWGGMEKGFLVLMREVPEGVEPRQWCIIIRHTDEA